MNVQGMTEYCAPDEGTMTWKDFNELKPCKHKNLIYLQYQSHWHFSAIFSYLEVSKGYFKPSKDPMNVDLIQGKFLWAWAMSSPRLAAVVSHVLGSGGVARDISDSSLVTPTDDGPFPLLKLKTPYQKLIKELVYFVKM